MNAKQTKYWLYYELNESDCEPELMGKVDTLAEAWTKVRESFLDAHETCPKNCRHPDEIPWFKNRELMPKGVEEGFFEMPAEGAELSTKGPTWIAIGGPDTYFVFPGDWYAHCDEEFERTVGVLGTNVTVVRGV